MYEPFLLYSNFEGGFLPFGNNVALPCKNLCVPFNFAFTVAVCADVSANSSNLCGGKKKYALLGYNTMK